MTAKLDTERMAKLPVWAQEKITSLERLVTKLRETNAAMNRTIDKDARPILTAEYYDEDRAYVLRPTSTLHYNFDGDDRLYNCLDVQLNTWNGGDGASIQINGAGPILVEPQSSNLIIVRRRL